MGQMLGNTSGQAPAPSNLGENPYAKLGKGAMGGLGQGLGNYGQQQQGLDQPRMQAPIQPQQAPQLSPDFWKLFYGG